jgi:hypothetical protein
MNDFAWMLEADPHESTTLLHQALLLAEVPGSPIGMDNPRRGTGAIWRTAAAAAVGQVEGARHETGKAAIPAFM